MNAAILTALEAKEAKIALITNAKGTQAVHDTVVALRANFRSGSANTKTKGRVLLSGAKSWRQKGTGRARTGCKASPIWRGGGVAFGPKPRSYAKRTPKQTKHLALRKAFSVRLLDKDILIVDSFRVAELKTKAFLTLLSDLLSDKGMSTRLTILIIDTVFDNTTLKAAHNVQKTLLIPAKDINTAHLLEYDKILLTRTALSVISERLAK